MGNMLCYEQNNDKKSEKKVTNEVINPQKQIQPTYYTNPATKDEDFTFNDKIKMQSIMNKYEVNYVPNFSDTNYELQWQEAAQIIIQDINRINTDPEWASSNAKNAFELIYSQKDEKIFFGSKKITTKQLNSDIININGPNTNELNDTHQNDNGSFRNSIQNGQNSLQNGQNSLQNGQNSIQNGQNSLQNGSQPVSNSKGKNSKLSNQTSKNMVVNVIKLEFEVNCCAEKMLKGLQNLQRFTNKVENQRIVESCTRKEFSISHILFSKQVQKVQRDLVLANYYTDIGTNLCNCYVSVNHHKVPESPDVTRTLIIKAGHTFFEEYDTVAQEQLTSSQHSVGNSYSNTLRKNSNSNAMRKSSRNNNRHTNNNTFGSMNLNIGQVRTKVRFYGEFFCKGNIDGNMIRNVFLTEFREYIAICKTIAMHESLSSSSEQEIEMDKQHIVGIENQFNYQ